MASCDEVTGTDVDSVEVVGETFKESGVGACGSDDGFFFLLGFEVLNSNLS